MQSSSTVLQKKQFLRWFLRNHQLKKREAVWIINYFLAVDSLLEQVHFVEQANGTPRGLSMTAFNEIGEPLILYLNGEALSDPEAIFENIKNNQQEPLFLQMNFAKSGLSPDYVAVLEDHPYLPQEAKLSIDEKQGVEEVLNQSVLQFQRSQLLKQIDTALDERNEARFNELVLSLQQLQR